MDTCSVFSLNSTGIKSQIILALYEGPLRAAKHEENLLTVFEIKPRNEREKHVWF